MPGHPPSQEVNSEQTPNPHGHSYRMHPDVTRNLKDPVKDCDPELGNQRPTDCLDDFDALMEAQKIQALPHRLVHIQGRLKNRAWDWFRREGRHIPSWEIFRTAFIFKFSDPKRRLAAMSRLHALKDTGNLRQYVQRFEELMTLAEEPFCDDKVLADIFIKGLKPARQTSIRTMQRREHRYNHSVREIIEELEYIEMDHEMGDIGQPRKEQPKTKSTIVPIKPRPACGDAHWLRDCPKRDTTQCIRLQTHEEAREAIQSGLEPNRGRRCCVESDQRGVGK